MRAGVMLLWFKKCVQLKLLKAAVPVWLFCTARKLQCFLIMPVITGLLDGLTLEKAVEHGRLFFQDYHSVLADDIAPQVLFTGPCLSSVVWLCVPLYALNYSSVHAY